MDTDGKLVRDRIPEIIEASGRQPTTRVLRHAERQPALLLKLQEWSDKLCDAATVAGQPEELADLLDVLKGIAAELGQPWPDIEAFADDKRARRGGFDAGIWLQLAPEA